MMIGPAPMMRMLLMSVRLGITLSLNIPVSFTSCGVRFVCRSPPGTRVGRFLLRLAAHPALLVPACSRRLRLRLVHQRGEAVEQIADVVRTGRRFRVAL